MTTNDLFELIDKLLPNSKISIDFLKMLSSSKNKNPENTYIYIELDEDQLALPTNVKVDIITKAVFKEYTDFVFGTYKVMIAVGGIDYQEQGIITPKYCFATLYYDEECNLVTSDFHSEIR